VKINDILELTHQKGENLASVAKRIDGIGEKRLNKAMKSVPCKPRGSGKKGWEYVGDDRSVLEKDIFEFAPKAKARTSEHKSVTTNEGKIEPTKEITNISTEEPTKETINVSTTEPTKETATVLRKRASFDIDVGLLKELKIEAVKRDKNAYEMVEEAIRRYLKE